MFLRFSQIFDQGARRGDGVFLARDSVRRERKRFELFEKVFLRVLDVERPGNVTGKWRQKIVPDFFQILGRDQHILVADDLRHGQFHQLIDRVLDRGNAAKLRHGKFSRRDVRPCHGDRVPRFEEGSYIIILCFVEHGVVDKRTRRNHPHDVPIDESAAFLGVGELFADRHLFSERHQFGNIDVRRMIGNPAHGSAFFESAVLARQRQIEELGNLLRILEKHLVKVAKTIKENTSLVFVLHFEIMPHHL